MEKLFEFALQTIYDVFNKFLKNAALLLITAIPPALLFSPFVMRKFPLLTFNYMPFRAFLFVLFFFFTYFCYLTAKKVKITFSNFFPLIGASNSDRSFAVVLITVVIYSISIFLFFLPEMIYAENENVQNIYPIFLILRWMPSLMATILIFLAPVFIFTIFFVFEGSYFKEGLTDSLKLCFRNKKKTYFLFFILFLILSALNLVFIGQFITVQVIFLFMFHIAFELNEETSVDGRGGYLKTAVNEESSFLSTPSKTEDAHSQRSSYKLFDGTNIPPSFSAAETAKNTIKTFTPKKTEQPIIVKKPFSTPSAGIKDVFKSAAENIKPAPITKPPEPKKEFSIFKPIPYNIDPDNKNFNKSNIDAQKEEESIVENKRGEKEGTFKESLTKPDDKDELNKRGEKEEIFIGNKSSITDKSNEPLETSFPFYVKSDKIIKNDDSSFVKKVVPKEEITQQNKNEKVANVSEYASEKVKESAVLEKEEDISFLDILLDDNKDDHTLKTDEPNDLKTTSDILNKLEDETEKDDEEIEIAFDINVDGENESLKKVQKELESSFAQPTLSKKPINPKLELPSTFKESGASGLVRKKNPKIDTSFGFDNYANTETASSVKKASSKNDKSENDKEYEITNDDDVK
jgi:hypothetical protein